MTYIFTNAKYRKCITCKCDLGYYYLTPIECTNCSVEKISNHLINILKI